MATEELELLAEEEIKGFLIFKDKYQALNPMPVKPSPVKQGWEFTAYILVSVASVLLASMRTAEQFYRAAAFSANPILGFVEAFLAIFTVEAGIVVYAAVLASRSKKISPWVLVTGIILLSLISITAGLGQSLHLATDLDPIFVRYTEYALLILIGPGASVAALIGGHILGQQIALAGQQYDELLNDYEHEMDDYHTKLKRTWERSPERKMVRMGKPVVTEEHLVSGEEEMMNAESTILTQPALSLADEVTRWLLHNGKTPYDEIDPILIAEDIGHDQDLVEITLEKMKNNGR